MKTAGVYELLGQPSYVNISPLTVSTIKVRVKNFEQVFLYKKTLIV